MKSIQLHIRSISKTFIELNKGKYLYFFIPGFVILFMFWQISLFTETVGSSFSFLGNTPFIGSYIKDGLETTFSFFQLMLEVIKVFFLLTLLSPFNSILSQKLDSELSGNSYKFDLVQLVNDMLRMFGIVIIAVLLEFITLGLYWLISYIFGLNFLDPVAYMVISAFYYGFAFYDYSLERHGIGVFESLGFAFSNVWLVTLSGSLFLLIYSIPWVGLVFAPILTTMITTIIYLDKEAKVKLN